METGDDRYTWDNEAEYQDFALDLVARIGAYESGQFDADHQEEEVIALFQELVDSGLAWQLQGHYGRTAFNLIKQGLVVDTRGVVSA